jgi:hypothetical protein
MPTIRDIVLNLGIDETFTKRRNGKRNETHNAVKNNIPLVEDYNMMADLLFLPTAKFGFKYLFVIVDLATDEFDIEPIKNKEPITILKAMQKCFTRDFVKAPKYTLKTDNGNEFKGVFHKYLYDESILHKVTLPHRHEGMGNVEALNRQLGRLFNGYMNQKETESGKPYKNWTDVVGVIRTELNAVRKKEVPEDINSYEYPVQEDLKKREIVVKRKGEKHTETVYDQIKPKYRIGQMVHRYLDHPKNALGKNQPTVQRREGDFLWEVEPRQIVKVITMGGQGPLHRYILDRLPNVSFTENQLKLARR